MKQYLLLILLLSIALNAKATDDDSCAAVLKKSLKSDLVEYIKLYENGVSNFDSFRVYTVKFYYDDRAKFSFDISQEYNRSFLYLNEKTYYTVIDQQYFIVVGTDDSLIETHTYLKSIFSKLDDANMLSTISNKLLPKERCCVMQHGDIEQKFIIQACSTEKADEGKLNKMPIPQYLLLKQ